MKHFTKLTQSYLKTRTLGLVAASLLTILGMSFAHDGEYRRPVKVTSTSGHVEVIHQIPGGIIVVGVDLGQARHRHRDVTIIREVPHREVTVIKTIKHGCGGKKITVIEKYETHGKRRHHPDSYVCR